MKLVLLVGMVLLAAGTLVAAAPTASAAPCAFRDCPPVQVGPCEHGWRWAGMSDEQGFWYPYVDCAA